MQRDYTSLNKFLLSKIFDLLPHWLPDGFVNDDVFDSKIGGSWVSVRLEDGHWWDHDEKGFGGSGLCSLYMHIHDCSPERAFDELTGEYDWPNERGQKNYPVGQLASPLAVKPSGEIDVYHHYPTKADGFHLFDAKENKWLPQYQECAEYLRQERGLKMRNGYAFIYSGNHYEPIADDELKKLIDSLLHCQRAPQAVNNFFKAMQYKCAEPDSAFIQPQGFINFLNGTLRISDRVLLPHSKDQFFRYVLPHNYDPSAGCNGWHEFLSFVFLDRKDLMGLAAEIFGYVLEGGHPWLHRSFILYGSGRNGKSTFLDVLQNAVGPANCCSVPIQKMNREFSVVKLDGKLANIVGELSVKDADSDAFKAITAGDPVMGGEKHKSDYLFRPTVRNLFAANHFPRFHDTSAGVVERLCIIPFEQYIPSDKREANIVSRLTAEIPGIIAWALDGLDRLKSRGHLPHVEAVAEKLHEYKTESDSIFAFMTACFRVETYTSIDDDTWDGESDVEIKYLSLVQTIKVKDVFGYYVTWCRKLGRFPCGDALFAKQFAVHVRQKYPHLREVKPGNNVAFKGKIWIVGSPSKFTRLAVADVLPFSR